MKKLYREKPILFCLFTMLIFCITLIVSNYIMEGIIKLFSLKVKDEYPFDMVKEMLVAAMGFLFIKVSNQEYIFKKPNSKSFFKGILTGGYLIFIAVFACLYYMALYICFKQGTIDADIAALFGVDFNHYGLLSMSHIVCFVVYMLCIGLAEEFFFRGVIAEKLMCIFIKKKNGVYKAILLSGLLFGCTHLINGFTTGFISSAVQAIQTSFVGMILVIVYYKNQNIWANVFIHAFFDFCELIMLGGIFGNAYEMTSIASAMDYGVENLVSVIPFIIVIIVLIRKKNINQMKDHYMVLQESE